MCVISYHTHFLIEDISQVWYVLEHSHIATYPAAETKTVPSLSFSSSTWPLWKNCKLHFLMLSDVHSGKKSAWTVSICKHSPGCKNTLEQQFIIQAQLELMCESKRMSLKNIHTDQDMWCRGVGSHGQGVTLKKWCNNCKRKPKSSSHWGLDSKSRRK